MLAFSAHNAGAEVDRLTDASCACAERVKVVGEGAIDPEVTGMFGPNGDHVLLRGLDRGVRDGGFVAVTLTFEVAGELPIEAEVVDD